MNLTKGKVHVYYVIDNTWVDLYHLSGVKGIAGSGISEKLFWFQELGDMVKGCEVHQTRLVPWWKCDTQGYRELFDSMRFAGMADSANGNCTTELEHVLEVWPGSERHFNPRL